MSDEHWTDERIQEFLDARPQEAGAFLLVEVDEDGIGLRKEMM